MCHRARYSLFALIFSSYILILGAIGILGTFVVATMGQLQTITNDLYAHPFAVSNAAAEIKISLLLVRTQMLRIFVLPAQTNALEEVRRHVQASEETTRANLAIIKSGFLGDMGRVHTLESLLDHWATVRQQILDAAARGDQATAERLLREDATPTFEATGPHIDYIIAFARERAKYFVAMAEAESARKISQTRWGVALLLAFVITTGLAMLGLVRSLQAQLMRQANLDFLTGLPNRRHFMELAEREVRRSLRYHTPFSLALVDLDLFKQVNDTHGHPVGDQVLQSFAATARKALRDSDIFGRIGGEEFAILLPNTRDDEAREVLERVRQAVAATPLDREEAPPLHITASFGLTCQSHGGQPDPLGQLLRRADTALYQAKQNGRNQVCAALPPA